MSNRLAWKLILVLVGILLLSGIVSALAISMTTKRAFKTLVREGDIAAARAISERLADFYRTRGSWRGLDEYLDSTAFSMLGHGMNPGMMGGPGRMPMRRSMPGRRGADGPGPGYRSGVKLLLAGREGRIIAHTLQEEPPDLSRGERLEQGVPVFAGRRIVGYLFLGSMIEPVLGPFQQAFLGNVYRAITYATLFAVLLGAGAGYYFIRSITEPLKSLSLAARGVTRGEYEPQLPDQRGDEIGDLSRSFLFMTHSLRDADEWKKKIISDSAHELRTPISVLQGNIEMMLEGVYPIDRQRIEGLQEETAVLSRLVEELQQLAKAEEGAGAYRFERIDVLEPLRHVYQSTRPLAAAAAIALHLEPPASSLTVDADRQKLMQAITNLVQNALRYSSAGGSVVVGGEAEGADLLLYVEDNGPGIPEAERELIFERFYRIERARTRRSGGSGLGLAIVREIALAHGGRAYVEPARALGGSRFTLRLPLSS